DKRKRDVVLVVADRCADATAAIARRFGALVLERGADEEPGRAAARQAGLEHASALDWDAVVMLDADSVIEPGFFDACERALAAGADAVQARGAGAGRGEAPERGRPRREPGLRGGAGGLRDPGHHAPPGPRPAWAVGAPARHGHGDPAAARPRASLPRACIGGPRLHTRPHPRPDAPPAPGHRPGAC